MASRQDGANAGPRENNARETQVIRNPPSVKKIGSKKRGGDPLLPSLHHWPMRYLWRQMASSLERGHGAVRAIKQVVRTMGEAPAEEKGEDRLLRAAELYEWEEAAGRGHTGECLEWLLRTTFDSEQITMLRTAWNCVKETEKAGDCLKRGFMLAACGRDGTFVLGAGERGDIARGMDGLEGLFYWTVEVARLRAEGAPEGRARETCRIVRNEVDVACRTFRHAFPNPEKFGRDENVVGAAALFDFVQTMLRAGTHLVTFLEMTGAILKRGK